MASFVSSGRVQVVLCNLAAPVPIVIYNIYAYPDAHRSREQRETTRALFAAVLEDAAARKLPY
eukprot:15240113-Alexandrium_andersonii.AAC.1